VSGAVTAEALLVVDLQQGWVSGEHAVDGSERLVARLRAAAGAAREAGSLVVHVQDVGDEDPAVPAGSPGRDLVLPVLEGDVVVEKLSGDAFGGTDLEAILRAAGVRSLVVAGLLSEMCVAETARTALRLGFEVVLPRDAHSTLAIAADGSGVDVSAAQVRRVAEWSLGDELTIVDEVTDVAFEAPAAPHMAG
jgi:nicotinamidase-related amidase